MSGLDLFLDQRVLVRMLLIATTAGVAMGVWFDLIAVFRFLCGEDPQRTIGKRQTIILSIIRFVGDVLFSVVSAIVFLLVCYFTSDGQMRSPAIFGIIIGFFLYRRTLGHIVRTALYAVVRLVRSIIYRFARWFVGMLRFIWLRIVCPIILIPLGRLAGKLYVVTIGKFIVFDRTRKTDRAIAEMVGKAADGFELVESFDQNVKKPNER